MVIFNNYLPFIFLLYIIIIGDIMYSINNNLFYKLEIKNSKFICYLFKINDKDEFDDILKYVKNEYKDATHYCYGFITDNYQKASDDGEPGGTAGMPILNSIKSNNLINTGAIVVRYFGGIKLGAGGLVRAYSKCVSEAIKNSSLIELINGINVDIEFSYNMSKDIDYILRNYEIINKEFNDSIKYNINITEKVLEELKSKIINYSINGEIYIEKK